MIRTIAGFSIFAIVGLVAMKFVFALLGGLLSIIGTILVWAFLGWIFYLVLKVIAPDAARRVREVISGKPA